MEEPIRDPLDVSNELAEREKQQVDGKKSDLDTETKSEEENEQRPHSTELVILNPSDVIIDKVVSETISSSDVKDEGNSCETVQKTTEIVTKTDANRNEVKIENVPASTINESPSTEEKSDDNKIVNDECSQVVESNKKEENIEEKKTEEMQKQDDEAKKEVINTTSNVQQSCNDSSRENDSDGGNKSVLKQTTGSSSSMCSNNNTDGKSSESNNEEEEVSVSFLDRVIKHALNNTLPIGNFDSSKPFDMVNRRPGGLPNFNHQPVTSTSSNNVASEASNKNAGGNTDSSVVVSGGGATVSCDNDNKEQVVTVSDLKGVNSGKETVSVQFLASNSQMMPPKQEMSSENNQNHAVVDSNKNVADSSKSSSESTHSVQQPVVTSSVSTNIMSSNVVQSTSQIMSQNEEQPQPLSMRRESNDATKTEFTRQEIIDKKYKTKEDLKNARMVASRFETGQNEQTLDLSLISPSPTTYAPPPKKISLPYVSNPDFSKKIFTAPEISGSSGTNPLHVRPPDFNRAASQTKELQIPNPNFKLKGGNESNLYNNASTKQNYRSNVPMTQEQLAELSKTHNYIPDLRLKSPTAAPIPVIHAAPSASHSNQRVNMSEEEPLPHVIHKGKYNDAPNVIPMRNDPPKMEHPKSVDPKIHYPPYKPKHVMESQIQYKSEMQSDLKHLRMEGNASKGSYQHPYQQQKYVMQKPPSQTDEINKPSFMYKIEDPKFNLLEHQQKEHEFSLKEKERQLRQEGTIITVKPSNDAKVLPQGSHIVPNNYHLEPAKLTKENVDRHLRETKHLYPPGHPSLSVLSKDMPLMMKPRGMGEPSYQKPELHHMPEQQKPSGYYIPYGDNVKGGSSFQKHPGYIHHPSMQKPGSSEVVYYPHPSVSPHAPVPRPSSIPSAGAMNPPVNWPNQRMAPSPHATNISPVFIHPSSKHSPSPTQFSRPPVAQSPTHSNKSVSPQLGPHQSQYRQVSYSPVHMQQKAPVPISDDKYRDRRVIASSPTIPPRHVVVYETERNYVEMPKGTHHRIPSRSEQYPPMKYGQQPQQTHDVPLRHAGSQESINRSSREYEMHKYAQYPQDRVEFRRSENDLTRVGYPTDQQIHNKRDDYRSHSSDRAAFERQKEYEYQSRARMPSASPTESYKIQLDISAAIKHETNRNDPQSRHHDPYHSGSSSRATMEVQSSPSPSHYQASILIRPSSSPSNPRIDASSSHIKTEAYVPPKEMRMDPPPTVITTPNHVVQARPSVVAPVLKRESPLDLSVKTVKTKADSTGSEQMYRRGEDRYVLPKVEFHPNFGGATRPIPREHPEQFEPSHAPSMHQSSQPHPIPSSSNTSSKYPQMQTHRSANPPYEVINHKNLNHIPMHQPGPNQRVPVEPPNVKYYEQDRQNMPVKPMQQNDGRTIHIEVGEPYRQEIPSNSHKQMQRQDPIHLRHTPYPMNDRPGTSNLKPMPIPNQSRGSVINNPNDPQRLEDRKYVESILYKKQPPPSAIANAEITFRYVHDKTTPRPSSPRKRPLDYHEGMQVPLKQVRYETSPRDILTHSSSHVNPMGQPNYPPQGYPEQKPMYPREPNVEIHAHKMIYERYPPESHTLRPVNQFSKQGNDPPPQQRHHSTHMYPDPRQPESKSHATVVKTFPKDSFRHDPKDEPRAGFPPPPHPTHSKYQPFFQKNPPMSDNPNENLHQKQTAVTWHPSAPSRVIQQTPDRFDVRNQYNATADALVTEKCEKMPVSSMENNTPAIVEQKDQVPGSSSMSTNKGADINTINKLRTSIEQKEMERQRVMMRKQNSSEISEDDSNKADIASILAARIRTKGELKGFTAVPVVEPPVKECPIELPKDPIEPPADIEGTTAFDVMDWGNACNDFVDQLQTGKKRGRRKRNTKQDEMNDPNKVDPYTNTTQNSDNLSTVPVEVLKSIEEPGNFSNSSDEDKPLKLLRQQSTPECKDEDSVGPRKGSETCSSAMKSGSMGERSSQSIRKKQRLVLEQKIAARIGTGSSSDTEPEDKPSVRTRKRKLRTRSSLGIKESDKSNDKSDQKAEKQTNDDDSSSETEEKIEKRITQLDGSSDSDNNQEKSGKRFRKASVADTKQKRISRHEKVSEQSEHSDTEERRKLLSKNKSSKRNKSKHTDSDGEKEETMTRSKRKLEMEKKISNSKVLRNDKIVQNVTVKKPKNVQEVASKTNINKNQQQGYKKKDDSKIENLKRKHLESDCEQNKTKSSGKRTTKNDSSAASSDDDPIKGDSKSDRLRPRKAKVSPGKDEAASKLKRKNSKAEEQKKGAPNKKTLQKSGQSSQTKFPPGWEAQLYAFKKSLKIPARLINVAPNNQRYSTSLPDLDPQSSDASEFSETSKASSLLTHIKTEENETESVNHKRSSKKSIIDLLHQRVTPSLNKMIHKKKMQKDIVSRLISKSGNENEQLPNPIVDGVGDKTSGDVRKSIFDLSVLKSRTRNEQKHMKNKEIIREIFCGEDRPSSAPPLGMDLDTTFDQKFGQIMKKMDDIVASTSTVIKQEFIPPQDEETTDTVLNVTNDRDVDDSVDRDLDTPSVNSERDMVTPVSFKDMPKPVKRGRQSRRKQSSGFDYIRKKKKPTPTNSDGTPVATKRRIAAVNYLQEKDENDISKEIKGWVLNKGVGECYLHKAARLGYLDVIAYCLFRIDMDVDTKDNAGYTALHEACSKGNLGIVRLLLQCGANHSETAFSGIRPLHEAVQNNYTEIARLLLAYGADPSLSTYSGQTPEMLAETKEMTNFINNYLKDMQGGVSKAWQLHPPWQQYDSDTEALDIFDGVSELFEETTTSERPSPMKNITKTCDSNLNNIIKVNDERIKYKSCTVVLNNIDHIKSFSPKTLRKSLDTIDSVIKSQFSDVISGNSESDGEMFEFEESDHPLPPLYLLKDEGTDKWIMLSDLCNLLKVKSKDAVLKQIDPNTPTSTLSKELVRELKISEFIEKATCLQLLCAGEKLNVRASKVVLVRYNEAVKKLLNVQTIVLKV